MVGPSVGAIVATSPASVLTSARFSAGNKPKATENTVGIIAPPRNPCAARNRIIEPRLSLCAHARLIRVKPSADSVNNSRVPIMRER